MTSLCPHCGTRTLPQQNFCRWCGTDLRGPSSGWWMNEWPSQSGRSASRLQVLSEVVHEALSAGLGQIRQMLHELQTGDRITALRRIGFWFFWAGLAALLSWANGVILIAVGLGLMAYARGFFRTTSAGPSAVTGATRSNAARHEMPISAAEEVSSVSSPEQALEPATRRIPDTIRQNRGPE